jgi:hypothetical protein
VERYSRPVGRVPRHRRLRRTGSPRATSRAHARRRPPARRPTS